MMLIWRVGWGRRKAIGQPVSIFQGRGGYRLGKVLRFIIQYANCFPFAGLYSLVFLVSHLISVLFAENLTSLKDFSLSWP